jgi:hypothetical protein
VWYNFKKVLIEYCEVKTVGLHFQNYPECSNEALAQTTLEKLAIYRQRNHERSPIMLSACLRNTIVIMIFMMLTTSSLLAASDRPRDDGWPRSYSSEGTGVTIYEPQIESWDGFNLKSHSAVAVKRGKKEIVYGVVSFSAQTIVDKSERLVKIEELQVDDAKFPSSADQPPAFLPVVKRAVLLKVKNIALDSLEAVMAVTNGMGLAGSVPVKNPVPKIIFSQKPSLLVYIDGDPRYAPLKDSDGTLRRVVNTGVFLVRDTSGKHYLSLYGGFMEAPALNGPWSVAVRPPAQLKQAVQAARNEGKIDLLEGQPDPKTNVTPSLAEIAPEIYIATQPTELIITDGEPNLVPIDGTQLLYVTNSSGNIFKHLRDNKTYVLLSGRWFRASSLSGAWEFVPPRDLPPDFEKIPDESPKENVKASVPGTLQAREALIANKIPQTSKISRDDARFIPLEFDGEPQLAAIEGTTMDYVVNCATPVIKVDYQTWYALENGVWFVASSLDGPWLLADSVHSVIYTIPPSSPLHYVTYVKIYKATSRYVYVGYTPGYYGTVVSDDVVVYGTGYYYTPWIGSVWYGPPITYGLGCSIAWTPWTGWGFTFGFGIGWGWGGGWYYPPSPWWGPYYYRGGYYGRGYYGRYAWGPGGWAHTTANAYYSRVYAPAAGLSYYPRSGGVRTYGSAYNSRNGTLAAGQRGTVQNVFRKDAVATTRTTGAATTTAGRGAQAQSRRDVSQVFSTRDGNVYRSSPHGNWEAVTPTGRKSSGGQTAAPRDFSREQRARQMGEQRYQSFHSIRPSQGFKTIPSGRGSGFGGSGYSYGGSGAGRGVAPAPSGGGFYGRGGEFSGGGSSRGGGYRR